ncbi:hypothetical protein CASFOL_038989 [Castilleja foliolosa]|uniref:Uncharacterized protein n=1 Tax=Castilleja foliolosa TaxID=1961234 RepID=A0ABD3BIY9_9LAMI
MRLERLQLWRRIYVVSRMVLLATIAGDGYIVHPSVPPTSTTSNFVVVSPNTRV